MSAKSEYTVVNGGQDVTIVLLGWIGAKMNALNKFAQIYQQKGYDTIVFTAPPDEDPSMLLEKRRDVFGIIDHLRTALDKKDIAIHVFSMNGIFTICSIQLQYPELNFFGRSRGVFFDSCPVDLGFDSISKFFYVWDEANADMLKSAGILQKAKYRMRMIAEITKLVNLYSSIAVKKALGIDVSKWSAYHFLLEHPDLPSVMFFVYSEADYVCEDETTKQFADHQMKIGKTVQMLHLKDSPHILHFRRYPKEYRQLMDNFCSHISQNRPHSKL